MKIVLIALICTCLAKTGLAQQDLLSFDEHNKYIYYQVVEIPGLPSDTLQARGINFIKAMLPKIKMKLADNHTNLSGEGKFVTYAGVSVLKHESGEIAYQVNIEFKDQKYRYWLTSFTFTPYQRDRYGNFVPQMGVNVPLEAAMTKFEKKDVDSYLNETGAFCKGFGDKLKLYMINAPKKEESVKKVVTDKW